MGFESIHAERRELPDQESLRAMKMELQNALLWENAPDPDDEDKFDEYVNGWIKDNFETLDAAFKSVIERNPELYEEWEVLEDREKVMEAVKEEMARLREHKERPLAA